MGGQTSLTLSSCIANLGGGVGVRMKPSPRGEDGCRDVPESDHALRRWPGMS